MLAKYSFRLDSFHIDNTRSRHNDTDTVAFFLKVGDRSYGTQTKGMGDLNNGDYGVGLEFRDILIPDPATRVTFNYQIVNAGHIDDIATKLSDAAARLEAIAGTNSQATSVAIAAEAFKLAGGGIWGLVAAGAVEVFNILWGWIGADCDGAVAIDEISVPRSDLDLKTPTGPYTETRHYPGPDSPHGCNHTNSDYYVTWSIIQSPVVQGAIAAKWNELGGLSGGLGEPVTDETSTPDGVGRFNNFQGGSIYWTPETGAHEIGGAIREKWANLGWEQSALRYPTSDETATIDWSGRYNTFQRGLIYWTAATGTYEVQGDIYAYYASINGLDSILGTPTSDETDLPDGSGRYNTFQHGELRWDRATRQVTLLPYGAPTTPPAKGPSNTPDWTPPNP